MELDLGVSETCLKAGLLLGVLQCARKGCSFRVTGVAPSHCCQACELACDDQADHDNQCVQMPLLGLSLETRSERGLLDFQHFGSQLRQLLEDKGPLHLNSLPHFWDTAYGSGAWAKTRPVKSARKACNTYSNGVKVLNQVVHLLEDPDDDSPELQQRCQADLEHFGSLSPEDIDILTDEFELVLRDLQVSTAIAQLPVQDAASLWRCRLTVQAEAAEDKEATPSLSPEPVEVAAYGRSAEEAFTMARLYLLSRLSRWDASKQLPRARLLEKLLQDFAGEMVTDEVDEDSLETCRRQLQELLQILEDLLMTPPSSFGSVWQLLARSWPRILAFCKDERSLVSLLRSARGCNKRPSLGVWCQMAEEAAFQLESPVLELFEDLLVEEEGAAGAYARQQIFSLLVEQREQMLQETERSSREQRVKVTWHLREASFGCTLAEPLKGKVDAVLLTNEQGSKFLCEALDESRLVVRASSCRLEELPGALSRRLSCQLLATYATIAGRQREALRKLPRKEKASFCPELRGAIIDSWAAREGRPEDEATLQRCAQLLAEDPVQDDPSEELLGQLTSPQQEALRNAQSRRCSLVRGPPGTGKTQVAAAVALAAAQGLGQGQRVLAVTQSHAAAINLHRRLESMGVIAARVGTTLTVAEVMEQKSFEEVKSCWGEDDEELNFLEEAQARREGDRSKELLKELQRCQFVVMRRMVIVSQVAVLTLASSGNVGLLQGMGTLPLLVVDEAAQVVEPGPWVPLSHGCQRLVLVGDEKQLPATIHHPLAFQRGLGISMFERFVRDGLVRMGNGFVQLDEQRRMHPSIAQFPSLAFYDGTVHDALETKQRQPVPGFPWPNPEYHVAFVECGFCEGEERRRSHANPREADVLLEVLSWCLSAGMKPCQIGVITGYSAQQELLQQRVAQLAKRLVFDPAELRVDTVDGFQGAERDLILASTVRSFSRVGFMRDPRRANVMLTRARRGLVVFGNGETLQTEEDTWKPWISWVRERGIELKAEVILPVEAGNDPGEPFTTPDLQSEVRSKWPPAWPAESTKPAEVPADRTNSAQSSALDWLAASEPCWPEVKVVPVPAAQEPVPQAEPEAMPEPREPRQPEELPEKLLEPSQPAEVWTEWVDPETGKLWLYNEVTGEAKWKD